MKFLALAFNVAILSGSVALSKTKPGNIIASGGSQGARPLHDANHDFCDPHAKHHSDTCALIGSDEVFSKEQCRKKHGVIEDYYLSGKYPERCEWIPHDYPGSSFTDPRHHNPKKFQYLVRVPNLREIEDPNTSKTLLLSTSIVDQTHRHLFRNNKCAFIFHAPPENFYVSYQFDLGLDNNVFSSKWLENVMKLGFHGQMSLSQIESHLTENVLAKHKHEYSNREDEDQEEITKNAIRINALKIKSILDFGNRMHSYITKEWELFGLSDPTTILENTLIKHDEIFDSHGQQKRSDKKGPNGDTKMWTPYNEVAVIGRSPLTNRAVELDGILCPENSDDPEFPKTKRVFEEYAKDKGVPFVIMKKAEY